jgi:hypothetical protein
VRSEVPADLSSHSELTSVLIAFRYVHALDRRRDARNRDPIPQLKGYRGLARLAVHVEADLIKRRNQLHAELTDAV